MNRIIKGLLWGLIIGICCLGMCLTTHAGTEYVDGYLRYVVVEESVTITGCNGEATEVTVPSIIAGVPVNTIAKGAFSNPWVKKINLPDTIMTIETGAFMAGQVVVYNSNMEERESEPEEPPSSNSPSRSEMHWTSQVSLEALELSEVAETVETVSQPNAIVSTKSDSVLSPSEETYGVEEEEFEFVENQKNNLSSDNMENGPSDQSGGIVWYILLMSLLVIAAIAFVWGFAKKKKHNTTEE